MIIDKAQIKTNIMVKPTIYKMALSSPPIASLSLPGQFINVKCGVDGSYDPLFKRPLSIHSVNNNTGEISVLYAVVGRGTTLLSNMHSGQKLEINGPLGKGFDLSKADTEYILLGGGLGVAPLLFAAEYLKNAGFPFSIIMGARSKDMICVENEFHSFCPHVNICTDDGSLGTKGFVTQRLEEVLSKNNSHKTVLACGPWEMLKAAVSLCGKFDAHIQVSLEERMACGLGVCLGCAVKTVNGMERVCHEGPVFDGKGVIWE